VSDLGYHKSDFYIFLQNENFLVAAKMKWWSVSYFCVSILLLEILNSFSVEGLALPANPKRKSKNVLTENSDQANSDHNSDLIPIPDNLLKKPTPKKVHGKTAKKILVLLHFAFLSLNKML
jgi:hypothetical protein